MMRNLIMVFTVCLAFVGIGSPITGQASDTKPTTQQTADYITQNYPKEIGARVRYEVKPPKYRWFTQTGTTNFSNISVIIEGKHLKFSWTELSKTESLAVDMDNEKTVKDDAVIVSMDLSRIHRIGVGIVQAAGEVNAWQENITHASCPAYLMFEQAEGPPAISVIVNGVKTSPSSVSVPVGVCKYSESDACLRDLKESQIFKALNHLRRLHGAPDAPKPIHFD